MAISESEVWEQFRKGDRSAFKFLFETYAPALLAYGRRLCRDKDTVEDNVQDLFVELWRSGDKLSPLTSVKFYLFRALRNKLSRVRSPDHIPSKVEAGLEPAVMYASSWEDELILRESEEENALMLHSRISALPDRQREAIHLRYFQNFSNEEVARLMGVNYNSACKFLYAGLKNLKALMKVAVLWLVLAILF